MAKGSVNKAILIGRLGGDPEIRYTPGGSAVANFTLATNRSWKDKEGNWQDETDWHRIVLWSRLAEVAKEYAKKGTRVYIEGRIQTRSWEDQNGQKKYTTEVVGNDFQLLDGPVGGGQSMGGGQEASPNLSTPENIDSAPDDVPF